MLGQFLYWAAAIVLGAALAWTVQTALTVRRMWQRRTPRQPLPEDAEVREFGLLFDDPEHG